MGRRLQTIYEYFNNYSEQQINDIIHCLSLEEKLIIRDRYGNDLHHPKTSDEWSEEKKKYFYGNIIPKMKKLLENSICKQEVEKDSQKKEDNIAKIETEIIKTEDIDYIVLLMQLLKEGKSNKEICEKLNINHQQLYEQLLNIKNRGVMYSRKYYSDGSIKYKNISSMPALKTNKEIGQDRTIITNTNENSLKLLVISDLHFGNELERLDLIDRAYNYCIKNGINIILCGGDLIDGAYTQGNQKITDLYKQIEYFIKNYPYDKSILTFSVAGDHDISAFYKSSLDIIETCNNFRHDIVIGGYNNVGINLKNDKVHLFHHTEGGSLRQTDAPIILHGHSHKYSTEIKNNVLNVTIPTLSEINQAMPSALELNLYFDKGYIKNSVIKHLYFGQENIILSESTFDLMKNRKINYEPLRNVEIFDSKKEKTLKKIPEHLSQIEKFNKRYGK